MPADHLTAAATSMIDHVEALLASNLCGLVQQDHDHAADLGEALETYHAAGRAALQRRSEQAWFQAGITPVDWATAEAAFVNQIAPRLDLLGRWWFLRKHPCWRIRIHDGDHPAALLDELAAGGVIAGWRPGIYEPETAAFGGLTAIEIVHDLFCADSRGVLDYARHDLPEPGRRELSLLLIAAMQQHAGLDWFEAGDVFARVAQMRPVPDDTSEARIDVLAAKMAPLLAAPPTDTASIVEQELGPHAVAWLTAFSEAGRKLGEAAAAGLLDRGLRAILAQIIIFHWNRLGLSARAQSILAYAAKTAILPPGK
ncbi:thiopeptide-type bacteriocin biosynthesis protein [Actinoplanes sp. NBC_00393]|uniref:thiopeptide-type bacteriocin biosynthesis protein n=1 Tax=Actinoplanes sp. NBC_00393 TaxID=2975953 RepID=UPI002E2231A2